jgi:rubredoxin
MDFLAPYRCPACESRLLNRLQTIHSDTEPWIECEVCQHVFEPPFEGGEQSTAGLGTSSVFEVDDCTLRTALRAHFAASR